MGFKWKGNSPRDLGLYYGRIPEQILESLEEPAEDIAREGANLMREYIRTRGTEKSGKAGRVESGDMLRFVRHRVDRDGKNKLRVRWGWLATRRAYFRYQENGFVHYQSGETIPPMHALLDSYMQQRDKIVRDIERRLK